MLYRDMRIAFVGEAIEQENKEMALAKERMNYVAPSLSQWRYPSSTLIRSRYLLFKNEDKWTPRQRQRSEILFIIIPLFRSGSQANDATGRYLHTTNDKVALPVWQDGVMPSKNPALNILER